MSTFELSDIGQLPREMIIEIFTFVPVSNISNIRLVCRDFHELSKEEKLWEVFAKNMYIKNTLKGSWEEAVKQRVEFWNQMKREYQAKPRILFSPPPSPPRPDFDALRRFVVNEERHQKDWLVQKWLQEQLQEQLLIRKDDRIESIQVDLFKDILERQPLQLNLFKDILERQDLQEPLERKTAFRKMVDSMKDLVSNVQQVVANFFSSSR